MLSKIKKLFVKDKASAESAAVMAESKADSSPKPRKTKTKNLSPKQHATKNNQPWHDVKLVTNPDDPRNGYYQMDWNEQHIAELRKSGYAGKTDEDVIEEWIRDICRTVAMENEEILDFIARPRVQSKKNDDGLTEYS